MSTKDEIIARIDDWCEKAGVQPTTFGKHLAGDGKFVARLKDGKSMTLDTYDKIVEFMESNPPADFNGFGNKGREAA